MNPEQIARLELVKILADKGEKLDASAVRRINLAVTFILTGKNPL